MKTLLAIILLATAGHATVDTYLATRNHAIAALKRNASPKTAESIEKHALDELEKQLEHLLEPLRVEGFFPHGKINLETLVEEQGYGRLDGLSYTAPKSDTRVVVSSEALLAAWMGAQHDLPKDLNQAIRSEAFYFQAIGGDAAFAMFAVIPVSPNEANNAAALLVQRRQDIGPGPPDEIVGTMTRRGRVFVVSQHVAIPIVPISACDTVRAAAQKKADAVLKAYNAGGSTDDKLFEAYTRLQDEGDAKSRLCFGEHFHEQPGYDALQRQAETLFDRLR